ncbi:hypothetical protein A9K55_007228 [Cordyceps militaris]|uniref:Wax synthase domain-containing protein n=1 Tax=Cordyceps militaris TaxID=73501 RepID=A0A2H4SIX1_CORMI|nr:hypothetical protein A9K55_007228 [Cordyceps militaris]
MAAAPPLFSLPGLSLAILSLVVYQLCFALILLCLPRRALLLRWLSLAPLSAAAYAVARHGVAPAGPPQRQAPLLGLLVIHWLGLAEYVLLSRVALTGPTRWRRRLWQALALSCNARRLGTPWEAKNVYSRRGPWSTPRFLAHVVPRVMLCYLVVDALMLAPPPDAHLVAVRKQTAWRLWTLTAEDVGFRAAATVLFWLVSYCIVYGLIHVAAVAAVVLGLSTPAFWPHLFGPVSELYTLRGFWGTFWHQRLRRTLTSFSDAVADHVLCIRRPSTLSTYTRLFLVFAISGLLHHPTDTVQGLPATETASVAFFLMQPLGIVAEDAAQALTRSWPLPRWVRSVAGYVWVAFFLVCTTPTWMFSIARLGQTPDLLPVKVARPLVAWLTGE